MNLLARKQKFNLLFKLVYLSADYFTILGSYILAYIIRREVDIVESLDVAQITEFNFAFRDFIPFAPWLSLLWLSMFLLVNHYREIEKRRSFDEFKSIFLASSLGLLSIMILTFFRGEQLFSRLITLYAWILSIFFLFTQRQILHFIQRWFWHRGVGVKQVILCNLGSSGQQFLEGIRQDGWAGVNIIGVVDAKTLKEENTNLKSVQSVQQQARTPGPIIEDSPYKVRGFAHLGHLDQIRELLDQYRPDEIVIGMGGVNPRQLERILQYSQKKRIPAYLLPDMLSFNGSITIEEVINGIPLLTPRKSPLRGISAIIKRLTDLVVSLLALVLFFPFLLLIALLVKFSSPGPVFFQQERIGFNGRMFRLYKFRGMHHQSVEKTGVHWTTENDDRRTRIGSFLRRFNLDELPQLWNVVKGDMSLIGPRPEQPHFVEDFQKQIPRYEERHLIRPGLTGLAQVNGWRGNTAIQERLHFDLYYLENWSLYLDLKITFKTLLTFFHGRGAY